MGRIAAWWRGLSRRGKVITIGAVVILFIAASAAGRETDDGSPLAEASPTPDQATPSEAPTPEPTAEPTPEATPEPTAPPTPTPVPTPVPTAPPAFADITLSGVGDAVARFEIPAEVAAIAAASHSGDSNFAVTTIAEDGSQNDLLVNTIGPYSGTVLFDESDQHSVAFEVTADGSWTITIKPLTAAFAWDGTAALTGTGDDVARIEPNISGLVSAQVTHSGESNFVVIVYSADGPDLLVNEIGNYSGEVLIGAGAFFLEITADGSWSVAPS